MSSPKYNRALLFLAGHWRSGRTLKSFSAEFLVDPGNLDRAFRQKYHMTVKAFISARRKEHVVRRLRKSEVYGYQIAQELGFPDDLSFYRWVRGAFGMGIRQLRAKVHEVDVRHMSTG